MVYVPYEFLHHFVRGYFDGDGNIYARGNMASFVGGSLAFMIGLSSVLENLGLQHRIKQTQQYYRLYISGRKTLKEFYNYIYNDKNLKHIEATNLTNNFHKRTKEAVAQRKKNFIDTYKSKQCLITSCKVVGIQKSTYQSWIKKDDIFKTEIQKIKSAQ